MYGRSKNSGIVGLSTVGSNRKKEPYRTPAARSIATERPWTNPKNPYKKNSVSSVQISVKSADATSLSSSDGPMPTAKQHPCIQNMGMAAVFLTPIGLIAVIVGIATNYWFRHEGNDVGLLVQCQNWTKSCGSMTDYVANQPNMIKITWQVGTPLEITGAGLMLIAMLCLICYPCHNKVNCSKLVCGSLIAVVMFLGYAFIATATILFVYHYVANSNTWQLQWSFYVGCGGAGCLLIPTAMFLTHVIYTGCFK